MAPFCIGYATGSFLHLSLKNEEELHLDSESRSIADNNLLLMIEDVLSYVQILHA